MIKAAPYTLATYRVKSGREEEFIKTWRDLAKTFSSLPHPPLWGTLIRSITDPTLFHSFGPWKEASHIKAMRTDPNALRAFERLGTLCTEISPGDYEMIEHVDVQRQTTD
jgi:quinol monooxygenase YgiN